MVQINDMYISIAHTHFYILNTPYIYAPWNYTPYVYTVCMYAILDQNLQKICLLLNYRINRYVWELLYLCDKRQVNKMCLRKMRYDRRNAGERNLIAHIYFLIHYLCSSKCLWWECIKFKNFNSSSSGQTRSQYVRWNVIISPPRKFERKYRRIEKQEKK